MSEESTSTAPGTFLSLSIASSAIFASFVRSGPRTVYWFRWVEKPPPANAETSLAVMRRSFGCFVTISRRTQSIIWSWVTVRVVGSVSPT